MRRDEIQTGDAGGVRNRPGLSGDHSSLEHLNCRNFRLDQLLTCPSSNVAGLLSGCGGACALLILGGIWVASGIAPWPRPGSLDPIWFLAPCGIAIILYLLGVVGFFRAVFDKTGRGVLWCILGMAIGMLTAIVACNAFYFAGGMSV
jgi:hypothetical protein